MLPSLVLETESRRPTSSSETSSRAGAREPERVSAPRPRIRRSSGSRTRRAARQPSAAGRCRVAPPARRPRPPARRRRLQRRWTWRPRAPRGTSRGRARGRVGSRRLAALRNRRPASPPRRCSNAIWARKRSTRARPSSSSTPASTPANSPSAASRSPASRFAPAAASSALRAVRGLGRERGGALEEGSDGRQSAARLRPPRGTLELCGDVLVGHGRRLRPVPGAAIRVDLRIGRFRQRAVDLAALLRPGRSVDGRANQRMTEHHSRRRASSRPSDSTAVRGRLGDPEPLGRPPHERRIADRVGRRDEQQAPRVAREAAPAGA